MRVELTELARLELETLIRTRELPADTAARVRESLSQLERFPLSGRALQGRYDGLRVLVGPWGWLGAIYELLDEEVVLVVGFVDARTLGALGH